MCFIEATNNLRHTCNITILNPFTKNNETFRNYILLKNMEYIKIPRGICLKEFEKCKILTIPKVVDFNLVSEFSLRPEQKVIVDTIRDEYNLKKVVNTIIVRPTAFGKTFTAINIINTLKFKALIVVNRDSLLKQWKTQCETYFPNNTVGILQGKVKLTDVDIIISTVQTLSLKSEISEKYLNKLQIGVLILDEIHTMSAEKFIQVLFKSNMPIRIGLTATLERTDQKEGLVLQHFTSVNQIQQVKKQQQTYLHFYKTDYNMSNIFTDFGNNLKFSEMLNQLANDESRNIQLIEIIKKYISNGNKILVVSDRINQLKYLYSHFGTDVASLCTSKNKPDFTKQIIFGIVSIVGTGLDVPELNVLVFAMPKKNIIQIIGRVFRKNHTVTIVDLIDIGPICMGQKRKRLEQYKNQIENLKITYE